MTLLSRTDSLTLATTKPPPKKVHPIILPICSIYAYTRARTHTHTTCRPFTPCHAYVAVVLRTQRREKERKRKGTREAECISSRHTMVARCIYEMDGYARDGYTAAGQQAALERGRGGGFFFSSLFCLWARWRERERWLYISYVGCCCCCHSIHAEIGTKEERKTKERG